MGGMGGRDRRASRRGRKFPTTVNRNGFGGGVSRHAARGCPRLKTESVQSCTMRMVAIDVG